MLKAKDLRDHSVEELQAMCSDSRNELFVLINQGKQEKKMEKTHSISQKRKDIARILTVLREKELAEQNTAG